MRLCTRCRTKIEPRRRKCSACGGKPGKPFTDHKIALRVLPDEAFVAANDGWNGCWICAYLELDPPMKGPIQRDHWHNGPHAGEPRGKLCIYHNRKLGPAYTPELLGAYLRYTTRRAA